MMRTTREETSSTSISAFDDSVHEAGCHHEMTRSDAGEWSETRYQDQSLARTLAIDTAQLRA